MQLAIPRDLFNYSKLLKSLGQLALKIHDAELTDYRIDQYVEDEDSGQFQIDFDDHNLLLYCSNYIVTCNGHFLTLASRYNSRDSYPLVFATRSEELNRVFNDNGEFTNEFLKYLAELQTIDPSED